MEIYKFHFNEKKNIISSHVRRFTALDSFAFVPICNSISFLGFDHSIDYFGSLLSMWPRSSCYIRCVRRIFPFSIISFFRLSYFFCPRLMVPSQYGHWTMKPNMMSEKKEAVKALEILCDPWETSGHHFSTSICVDCLFIINSCKCSAYVHFFLQPHATKSITYLALLL